MTDKSLILQTRDFDKVVNMLRDFFHAKGFLETHTQNRLSILAACEDPSTIATYNYRDPRTGKTEVWPLPQTGQMWLEYELLTNPEYNGVFCVSTSYRNEQNPVEGRHLTIFPMFEFEMKGGMEDLARLECELLSYLGYTNINRVDYCATALKYGTELLDNSHEERLYKDYGSAVLLCDFPNTTSPFWNMRQHPNGDKAYKIDVILSGQETIGSAERSTDVCAMRRMFDTIGGGEYSALLYSKFERSRIDGELNEFLSHNMFQRFGGGIGISRLIRSMRMEGLL